MKIFISTSAFAKFDKKPLELLGNKKIEHTLNPFKRKLTEDEIIGILKTNQYVGLIAGNEPLTKKALAGTNSLKVISRPGVGLDNVDLEAAKDFNIQVYNTPDILTDSVAELTIGLILCCLRKICQMNRQTHEKVWQKQIGSLFKGKTLGLIGFGKIGQRVAELARAFGAEIIFYDLRQIKNKIAQQVSFEDLYKESDIISIHSSGRDKIIGEPEILKMKDGVLLINTARGQSIDEDSLYKGIISGKIKAAGLDVYHQEPYSGKLLELDNIVTTPHIGSYAKEAKLKMELEAVKNLLRGLGFE